MNKYLYIILIALLFLTACEDVVTIDLDEGSKELVIDAWINDLPQTQEIRLRETIPYFESVAAPAVLGATVTITDDNGRVYSFEDNNNLGNYQWTPPTGETFGTMGQNYTLQIVLGEKNYTAFSTLNPTVPVDSITYVFEEETSFQKAGYEAQFFGRDLAGLGNAYWIKAYKNGRFLGKPQEINIAYDAGFSVGSEVDGIIFITPIRENINRWADTGDGATDDFEEPPYKLGDQIRVEIHSITLEAFLYLERARTQLTLGDATLFAEPPSNVPTNITSSVESENPQGFFVVSAVSSLEQEIE